MTSPAARMTIVTMVEQAMAEGARQRQACAIVGLSARTLQRWQRDDATVDQRPMRVQIPANRLDDLERQRILAIANSVEFGSLPPSQIVPRLTDQGLYVASESTFYRVLKEANQSKHRSAARPGKERSKPRALCATTPNQLYSWDITYLPGKVKGTHYYLYMFIDIFSRKIVGWQVYQEESAGLASELIRDICMQEGVRPNQVVLHSDNGTSMKGATMLATLQALGVMPSFSRPAVSNDNPYSEALFKTLKYRPNYPTSRFDSLAQARRWAGEFTRWYNHEHRHSAIGYVTPCERHAGKDQELLRRRTKVYEAARAANPGRWSGAVRDWSPVREVHLNPDRADEKTCESTDTNWGNKAAA
jgi:putative transposase